MNFRRELHNAYRNAGIPIICLRHAPAALLEDPEDAQQ